MQRMILLLSAVVLTGCSALSALDDASQPLEIYELRTPAFGPAASRRGVELVVEEPIASGALATERIMIRPAPLRAQYLPGVRWADPAPVMLQTLLVRSLAQTEALGSVGRRPVGTLADYALLGELTDFQAEVADGAAPVVRARLLLRVVRESDARVIASRTFIATRPAVSEDPDAVTAAFDAATSQLLSDIVPWVLARMGAGV